MTKYDEASTQDTVDSRHGEEFNVNAKLNEISADDTVSDRLLRATSIVEQALSKAKGPQLNRPGAIDIIVSDLHLDSTGYQVVSELLQEAIGVVDLRRLENLLNDNSLLTLVTLVGHALTSADSSYWNSINTKLGFKDQEWFPNFVRSNLRKWLVSKSLNTFDKAHFSHKDFVSVIYLHAGLAARDVVDLHYLLNESRVEGITFSSSEEFASFLRTADQDDKLSSSLRNLLLITPKRAEDVVQCVYEVTQFASTTEDWESRFEDGYTASLPEPTFRTLTDLLAGRELSFVQESASKVVASKARGPFIAMDLDNSVLELVLPEITGTETVDLNAYERSFLFDGKRINVTQPRDFTTLGFKEVRIAIDAPTHHIAEDTEGSPVRVATVVDPAVPFLFFGASGQLRRNQKNISGSFVYLLAPQKATFQGHSSTVRTSQVQGWRGWKLAYLRLGSHPLTISHEEHRWSVNVNRKTGAEWGFEGTQIPSVFGSNRRPVLHTIPTLTVPDDGATWTVKGVQVLPAGETLDLDEYEAPEYGFPFPVLDKTEGDPWVGVFRFSVFKDGRLHDSREIHLAEGLRCSVICRDNGARDFRVLNPSPNARNYQERIQSIKLTKAFARFSQNDDNGLKLPEDRSVGSPDSPTTFTVRNASWPDDYQLPVTVEAPALDYRLPITTETNRWLREFATFDAEELDDNALFELRFPVPVEKDVSLILFKQVGRDGRVAKTLLLTPNSGRRVWTLSLHLLLREIKDDGSYILTVTWHSETAFDNFRRHFPKRSYKGEDHRQAQSSILARVTRAPLLQGVEIHGDKSKLILGRAPSKNLDVRVWKLFSPSTPPAALKIDSANFTLPKEFVNCGPLVIDVREQAFLSQWNPTRPSKHAVVFDDQSMNAWTTTSIADAWMFRPIRKSILFPGELQKVWESRRLFANVLKSASPSMQDFDQATQQHLTSSPRASLNVLHTTSLTPSEQLSVLISSGLSTKSFASEETSGEIHPVPWIGLLQEMNDIATLQARSQYSEPNSELAESLHYVLETGGSDLEGILSGNTNASAIVQDAQRTLDALPSQLSDRLFQLEGRLSVAALEEKTISLTSRLSAYAEVIRQAPSLNKIAGVDQIFEIAEKYETLIGQYGDEKAYTATTTLHDLGRNSPESWRKVPYISYVTMLLARLIAQNLIRPIEDLEILRFALAEIAGLVPNLFTFDLVYSEAIALKAIRMNLEGKK